LALAIVMGPAGAWAQQKVVVYSANDSTLNDLVFAAFTKATGIQVESVSTGSGVLFKRIQAEKDRPQGDIIWGVARSLLETNKAYFQPYRSKNVDAIPAEYRDPNDLWIGNNLQILVLLQNTKELAADQGPKGWEDLLQPKWKGKIAFTDPANSGSAFTNTTLLVDQWGGGDKGWEKVKKLFANLKVLNRSSLVFQGVGNGEYPLGISLEYAGYLWAQGGAPVKTVYPADGTLVLMEGCAIIKGGPNTEAAKQFVDWINAKETRELILKATFRRPARQDLDLSKLPGNMPALSAMKLLKYDEDAWTAKRDDALAKIKDIIQETR
jgi:iron(III) transport system substrate-binding protein